MYFENQKETALKLFDRHKSVTKVIQILGYPSRQTLYHWIAQRNEGPKQKSTFRGVNSTEHPRHPPVEVKLSALHRCFELGEDVKCVSDEIGYSRASIYIWRRKFLLKGAVALMNSADDPRGNLPEGEMAPSLEMEKLGAQIQDMRMEIDILKETIEVLKKDRGVDWATLRNQEKAVIVDALRSKYSLPMLLQNLKLSRSSYYYQHKQALLPDKYGLLCLRIKTLYYENAGRYGYRRIHALLIRENLHISEKVIRRIMKENGLTVMMNRRKPYSSYRGEITPAVHNVIERDFHADAPNEKWLTDITEFALPFGKIYLSPIVDCFDGLIPCWSISRTPDAKLVNDMLDQAIDSLKENEHPLIHTDRGCHYRWPGWVTKMDNAGLQRSMSRKGCSPDNAACEGFFGRLKNEMFYHQSWVDVNIQQFTEILNDYLVWYNEKRIKVSLGNMSPLEYRRSLGFVA